LRATLSLRFLIAIAVGSHSPGSRRRACSLQQLDDLLRGQPAPLDPGTFQPEPIARIVNDRRTASERHRRLQIARASDAWDRQPLEKRSVAGVVELRDVDDRPLDWYDSQRVKRWQGVVARSIRAASGVRAGIPLAAWRDRVETIAPSFSAAYRRAASNGDVQLGNPIDGEE
jgi:hypothetical protein